jgi:mannose-6-phosphate isomerase-like protein (cupin superfamily)
MEKNYAIAQLEAIPPVPCSCGQARRAFGEEPEQVATLHLVDIKKDAAAHYHKRMTEIYVVLQGEGEVELDGERIAVKPMTSIMIKPGCRHRAIGENLRILNVPVPAFDPTDEWFDEVT